MEDDRYHFEQCFGKGVNPTLVSQYIETRVKLRSEHQKLLDQLDSDCPNYDHYYASLEKLMNDAITSLREIMYDDDIRRIMGYVTEDDIKQNIFLMDKWYQK